MNLFQFIVMTAMSVFTNPEPNSCESEETDATQVNECGSPLCVTIKEGVAHTASCDNCGTWTPGAPVTCGDIVCQPSGQASECRWVCRPSADW